MLLSELFIPLSFNQQRVWFLDRLLPEASIYNFTAAFHLKGSLNLEALKKAFESVCQRHEILRTTIREEAYQYISEPCPFIIKEIIEQNIDKAPILLEIEGSKPFDLVTDPLIRAQLIHCDIEDSILQITIHHMIADRWSMKIFLSELSLFYQAHCQNKPLKLDELPIQYADFSIWQRELLQGSLFDKQLEYWKEYLKEIPESLQLSTDKPRPEELSYKGKTYSKVLDSDLLLKVRHVSQDMGVTPFMFLLATYQTLLYRYTQQTDILVGYPIANRHYPQVEELIGFFANTLVIRTQFHPAITFKEIVNQVKESILNAYDHQDIPFEQLVDYLKVSRHLKLHPVFQTMFLMEEESLSELSLENLETTSIPVDLQTSKFDLTLIIKENLLQIEYATDLFEENTISRLADHFLNLLKGMLSNPFCNVSSIDFLTENELNLLLFKKEGDFPESTLQELFEQQVAKTPHVIATIFKDQSLTYEQMNQRANQWAHHLRSLGITREKLVAISLERSAEMIIAILGILKAGGAYVPIDPNYPLDRINFVLEDTQATVFITVQGDQFTTFQGKIVNPNEVDNLNISNPSPECLPPNLCYILYTSGSTGKPKGVMIEHRAVIHCIKSIAALIPLSCEDHFLALTSLTFDVSVLDYFLPYFLGAQVVIADHETMKNPYSISELIQTYAISSMQATPTTCRLLGDSGWDTKQPLKMLIAGEALPSQLAAQLVGKVEIYNIYGPTEATIYSTLSHVTNPNKITIGHPLSHVTAYILDNNLHLVPFGVIGELHIGGLGLARGYLNRSLLTAEKFIQDPFWEDQHARLYKTGDLARLLPDGQIEFLGRIDDQVKIRGYRIELGEISSALQKHEKIKDAVVIAKRDQEGSQRLIAYFISQGLQPIISDLRTHLEKFLPDYMIPASYVMLETFPVNSSGKLDKKALPTPEFTTRAVENTIVLPQNGIEKTLVDIWAELLHIKDIGIHDNFFHIGGDSIISIQFVSKAKQKGIFIELKQVFKTPTIAALAQYAKLENLTPKASFPAPSGQVKLSPIQKWFFDQNLKDYNHFNQALFLEAKHPLDPIILEKALKYVVDHHSTFSLRFCQDQTGWSQEYSEDNSQQTLSFLHISENSDSETIEYAVKMVQEGMNIHQAPLISAVLASPNHLFIAIHHLIIDGISWRILLKDLETVYDKLNQNQSIQLPESSSSYQAWTDAVNHFSQSDGLKDELSYWNKTIEKLTWQIPTDFNFGSNLQKAAKKVHYSLSEEITFSLLKEAPKAYRTQVNDILLSALVLAFGDWSGQYALALSLEGHGRELQSEQLDLSRSIGWFTSLFPLFLSLKAPEELGKSLKEIKETLRAIPNKGVGYGILRYHTNQLESHPVPQVCFNYLGQWETSFDDNALFKLSDKPIGECSGSNNSREHLIEILAQSKNGRLNIEWTYSTHHFSAATIETLGQNFTNRLQQLIQYCCHQDHFGYTPSDFSLSQLNQETLDQVFGKNPGIDDIYPVSPLQEGLLFGTLYAPDSDVYITQALYEFNGPFEKNILQKAWKEVVAQYAVLRTGFIWEGLPSPYQFVTNSTELKWYEHSLKTISEENLESYIKEIMDSDRKNIFNLSEPPLSRQYWCEVNDQRFFLLWSKHHIILDGWSEALILQKVFEVYHILLERSSCHLPVVPPYKDYVAWICQQDLKKAEIFWRHYLKGIDEPICFDETITKIHQSYQFSLTSEESEKLRAMSKCSGLTLNTLILGAWCLFLGKYLQKDDFLTGLTVSGRSVDLQQIEQMAGLLIQTIPFRVHFSQTESVLSFLKRVQEDVLLLQEFGYASLSQLQKWSDIETGKSLFDHLFLFENFPIVNSLTKGNISTHSFIDKNEYPLTIGVFPTEQIHFLINSKFPLDKLIQFSSCLKEVILNISSDETLLIGDISLLNKNEQHRILHTWNQTEADFPTDKTLHHLFEEQVEKTPEATACMFNDKRLTYKELNQQATQLAILLKKQGVIKESLVYVCLERSFEMVIALLGILKAGGAYVPLDPVNPKERLKTIMQDTKTLLITQTSLCDKTDFFQGNNILIDRLFPFELPRESDEPRPKGRGMIGAEFQLGPNYGLNYPALKGQVSGDLDEDLEEEEDSADSLAYVIYTSGSTGVPKGVCIQHRAIVNRIVWMQKEYQLCSEDRVLQKTPYSFDVSVWEFFWPLINGATLSIAPPGLHQDPYQLISFIVKNQISIIHFVPSMLRQFFQTEGVEKCTSLRLVFSSGEALTCDLEKQFFLKLQSKLHNLYGPTEAAVDVTYWECKPDSGLTFVPIGKPISNIQMYILDKYSKPVPIGVGGELHIGGVGLAKGYFNSRDITEAKFIESPFSNNPEDRLYKTGDLARFMPDGNIEYLGRIDHQVKIHGFRIELGEIETALKKHQDVQDAVVIANQKQQLYAYIIPKSMTPDQIILRKLLETLLPHYMIPSAFMFLESYPLTSSGKLDKKALPLPEALPVSNILATTEEEKILVEIWSKLLHTKQVGIHDNFFHLGGDSIISIQVASLARQKGIHYEIKQIFETPTIAGILSHVKRTKPIQQDYHLKRGEIELTPIQLWFFEQALDNYHHFNQAVLLNVKEPLGIDRLNLALQLLIQRHEVFSFKYSRISSFEWKQEYTNDSKSIAICMDTVELSEQILQAHESIDIEKGEHLKVVCFRLPEGKFKLLIVIHHLVVDGVSWRILLRDLEAFYRDDAPTLPAKTAPYQHFSAALKKYGDQIHEEFPFWADVIAKNHMDFPVDFDKGPNTNLTSEKVFIRLNEKATSSLIRKAPSAYRTEINDLLLAALVLAKGDWKGDYTLNLCLEGHGRENIDDTIDISQTIGWFTSLYPVYLRLDHPTDLSHCIKSVKEQLRSIPNKGIGYGVLKYLKKENTLNQGKEPQLIFNYLGQWELSNDKDSLFSFAEESAGPSSAKENKRPYLISVNAEIRNEELTIGFKFSTNHYHLESIKKLAECYQQRMMQIIDHCSDGKNFGYTPSDFPLARLNQQTLDDLFCKDANIEEVYPLGPMQEGLLFYSLLEPDSDAYLIQTLFEIQKEINLEFLKHAFSQVVECYSILRTAIVWKGLTRPLQIVFKSIALPWSLHEINSEQQLQTLLENDRKVFFDIGKAPLFRIQIILHNKKIYLVWTRHHLILDGWSSSLIINQLMAFYSGNYTRSRPYKDYIAWMLNQNREKAKTFWQTYLKGFVKNRSHFSFEEKKSASHQVHHFCLTDAETSQIVKAVQKTSLTISILVYGTWGLLLNHYHQTDDIIFGCTVSGRSIDLSTIEHMAGLFIHTLPLRIQLFSEDEVLAYLEKIQKIVLAIQENATIPLSIIQECKDERNLGPLFDSIVIFENYPTDASLNIKVVKNEETTEFPLTIHAKLKDELHVTFHGYVDISYLKRLENQFKTIMMSLASSLEIDG